MADFTYEPTTADIEKFFELHPEFLAKFQLIILIRMHSELLDKVPEELVPIPTTGETEP